MRCGNGDTNGSLHMTRDHVAISSGDEPNNDFFL